MNEKPRVSKKTVNGVGKVSGHLPHPIVVGLVTDACDLHSARLEVDHEEHEVSNKPASRQHFNGEEVRRTAMAPQ